MDERTKRRCAASLAMTALVGGLAVPAVAERWTERLGEDVVPLAQSVDLTLDPASVDYRGSVAIALRVTAGVDSFLLHGEGLEIDAVRLADADGAGRAVRWSPVADDALAIRSGDRLEPGDYRLEMEFHAPFDTTAVSIYRLDYEGLPYVFSQFQSDDAREAFPCFDEPAFKIPFRFTLRTPDSLVAISNTPVESEESGDGWRTTAFAETPPLPTYLLAVAVGPFDLVDVPGFPVPARIVTPRGKAHLTGTVRDEMGPIMAALESWFDRPYPYRKLDLLAVPEFWPGAMEHPGAITYRDTVLLTDPDALTPAQLGVLVRFTAHEFAHQWFGNLVTLEWWDDLWLNESFADWMGDRITEEVHPELNVAEAQLGVTQRILRADARPSSRPIRRPIRPGESLLESVFTTYLKGKLVLGMFEAWAGPEDFRRGVLDYLAANEWGSATSGDLWQALDGASGQPVSRALAGFLEQAGSPFLKVEREGPARVRVEQTRFRSAGVSTPDQQWEVPVEFRYFDGDSVRTRTVLLRDATAVVDLEARGPIEWIYPNGGARGYYRWSLPAEGLARLAYAAPAALSPRERIELLGNAGSLLEAGQLGAGTYLEMLTGFAGDPNPSVLGSVQAGLSRVRQVLPDPASREAFPIYVRSLLSAALDRFGLEPRRDEEESVTAFRPQLVNTLGDWGRDEAIRRQAGARARDYLRDPDTVDPSLASTWLVLAARDGDGDLWDTFEERFRAAEIPSDRRRYLGLLGSFRDPALRERGLAYALTTKLKPQEMLAIPRTVAAQGEEQADLVADWVMDHHATLFAALPPPGRPGLVRFGAGCSRERWKRVRDYFSSLEEDVPGLDRQIGSVDDAVEDCVRLREREAEAVRSFLLAFASERRSGEEPRF